MGVSVFDTGTWLSAGAWDRGCGQFPNNWTGTCWR